jgi:signal transduction histidine kinase
MLGNPEFTNSYENESPHESTSANVYFRAHDKNNIIVRGRRVKQNGEVISNLRVSMKTDQANDEDSNYLKEEYLRAKQRLRKHSAPKVAPLKFNFDAGNFEDRVVLPPS